MAGNNLKLQVLLSAIDRASGPLKRIMGGSSATAKALRATKERLGELERAQQKIQGFRKISAQAAESGIAMKAAHQRVTQLKAAMAGVENPTAKATRALAKAQREAVKLKDAHIGNLRQLKLSKAALASAGMEVSKLGSHEKRLAGDIGKASRAIEGQRKQLARLSAAQARMQRMHSAGMKFAAHGAGAVAAGTVASRGLVAPIASFANQEDAATQLRAAMMDASGKVAPEFAQIDALAQKLGNRLPGTTADFYEMFTMLRRQGMTSQVILGGLGEATAFLGVQLRMGYSDAAEFAAKLQDATRTTESDMMSLSDVIQRTFYLGVDADNMLQGFSKLTPAMDVLKRHGIDAARTFAPLLVMADQAGMKGEAAGNAYRKVFQGAMDAKKLDKANALIKGTGIKLDFTDGKGEFGGLDQMFVQLKKLEKLNTQDRLAVMKKLFGDDAETLQVVSLLVSKGAAGYAEVQAKMAAQASLQQRVNSQLGTLRNLWDAASGTFVNGLAAMGEAVAPDLKALVDWITKAAERFSTWAKENPKLAGGLFKVAAVLTAVVLAAGGLALVLGTILMPFAGLQMALTTAAPLFAGLGKLLLGFGGRVLPLVATGVRMVGMAITANPIGILLMLLAGLVYLIYRNWDTFGPWFKALWDGIVVVAGWAWEWIKKLFAWSPLGLIIRNWDIIKAYFSRLWGGIKLYVSGAWDVITGIFSGDGSKIRGGLQMMWTAINGVLGGWPAKFMQFGVDLIQGLINGIRNMAGAVKDAVVGAVSGAVDKFKAFLQIRSPSRVFARFGDYTMQGFAGGLDRSKRLPLQRMSAFGSRLQQAGAGIAMAAAATPAMAIDNRPPLSPMAASARAGGDTFHITIHAGAGTPAQDIAREVREAIEQLERERSARTRSRLGDYGD